ncbi:nucleotidyltransferase family protein [Emcibacter sp. SYSU 3D8]|uniref:nucleotidyltransferase family protein n=1 Tax=Emcibacter sp. SYSU 3D8 TaxID=3133969 RepID=UPI0031FE9021
MRRPPSNAALAAAILPDWQDVQLLRACLLQKEPATRAWAAWCGAVGNPKRELETETRGLKGILPLLDASTRAHALPGPDGMGIYLKASTLREDLRTRIIHRILLGTLEALEADGIPYVLLGGIVAAHTVYPVPSHRHCHAIDLLAPDSAAGTLARAGFTPLTGSPGAFQHAEMLMLNLRQDIAFHPHHQLPDGGIAARAQPVDLGDRAAPGAGATDRLIMALSRAASTPDRGNLRWACDVWLTAPDVDWRLFVDETVRRRLSLPFAVLCRGLAEALDAAIPAGVIARLEDEAARARPIDREAALAGALTGLSAARRALSAPGAGLPERLEIARFLALPSPQCLGWTYGPAGTVARTLQRLHRPVAYVVERTRQRLAG